MKLNPKTLVLSAFAVFLVLSVPSCAKNKDENNAKPPVSSVSSSVSEVSSSSSSPSDPPPSSSQPPKIIDGFERVVDVDSSIVINLKYATTDNFTHQKIYPTDVCVLREKTAQKLASANRAFREQGYRLEIWDAYRPVSVQKTFWSIEPDTRYVADPNNGGSVHNRGCAVDVTLVDDAGQEIEMPTGFDDFTDKAHRDSTEMSQKAKEDLDLLTKGMTENGFVTIRTEWWHFEDSDMSSYPIADVDLSLFQ